MGQHWVWVVGPIPDLGQCMPIDTHALTALFHPHQVDKEASELHKKGFERRSYTYTAPNPDNCAEVGMDVEFNFKETRKRSAAAPNSRTQSSTIWAHLFAHTRIGASQTS